MDRGLDGLVPSHSGKEHKAPQHPQSGPKGLIGLHRGAWVIPRSYGGQCLSAQSWDHGKGQASAPVPGFISTKSGSCSQSPAEG